MAIAYTAKEPKKSTASRKDVRRVEVPVVEDGAKVASAGSVAGTQALPVDTIPKPKMGRPRTGYIKAEYNRQYSADKRAALKLGISVPEYRAIHTPYPVDENTTTK